MFYAVFCKVDILGNKMPHKKHKLDEILNYRCIMASNASIMGGLSSDLRSTFMLQAED